MGRDDLNPSRQSVQQDCASHGKLHQVTNADGDGGPMKAMVGKAIFVLVCTAGVALAIVQYMEMLRLIPQHCVI
jgi:hypothetical protein